eukprot:COSAG02_NODE_2468_length_8763_cov_3.000923_2_plen_82_part_00
MNRESQCTLLYESAEFLYATPGYGNPVWSRALDEVMHPLSSIAIALHFSVDYPDLIALPAALLLQLAGQLLQLLQLVGQLL